MFSLRSILMAAVAFATITSAIPAPALPIPGSSGVANPLEKLNLGTVGGSAIPGQETKRGLSSPGDAFKKCHDGIAVIVIKISDAVHCDGGPSNVDHELVISLLGKIVILLQVLLKELKVIVVAELTLNGVACTVVELAKVIAGLLILVVNVVYLVLSIVGFLDVALCGVIVTIGALLCDILTLVLHLVIGLKVELAILLKVLVGNCGYVHYDKILVLVGL